VRAVPAHILPKSKASPSLLAHIVTAKYVYGLPLHRQEAQFRRLGVELSRATMASWIVKLGECIVPIVNPLNEEILDAPLVQCDETRLQVLKSGKTATADHWIWVPAAAPPQRRIILFDYDPSRGGAVPMRLLDGFTGIPQTDCYEAYCAVAEARQAATSEERLSVRQMQSAPVLAEFKASLDKMVDLVLPQRALGKAINYSLGQFLKLGHFLKYPETPLDSNRVENAIRSFVIGHKG
jgi:hypothetical protein